MKKHELTTVDQLQIGDRFYFPTDKSKVVWEMVEHETTSTHFRTYKYFCLVGSYADRVSCPKQRNLNARGIMGNTKVIYLRSVKEVTA